MYPILPTDLLLSALCWLLVCHTELLLVHLLSNDGLHTDVDKGQNQIFSSLCVGRQWRIHYDGFVNASGELFKGIIKIFGPVSSSNGPEQNLQILFM